MNTRRLWLYRLMSGFLPESCFFNFKVWLLRWCGAKIGDNVRINSSVRFLGPGRLIIGDDVWIGPETILCTGVGGNIEIGSHVDISFRVNVSTGSHEIDVQGLHSAGQGTQKSIVIQDGVWIGMGASVLQGVTISKKAIVAAGAVVTKDCADYCLYAGIPAVKKKRLI